MIDDGESSSSESETADLLELRLNHARGDYAEVDRILLQLQGKPSDDLQAIVASRPDLLDVLAVQLTTPAGILRGMELVVELSNRKAGQKRIVVSFEELGLFMNNNSEAAELTSDLMLQKMLTVSGRAQEFIANNKVEAEEARIKAILSYINFYLTVEVGVAPMLRAKYPERPPRQIDGEKIPYLKELMQDLQDVDIPTRTLADYVRYGKVFWEFGKACGILSLILLAGIGIGVTVLARQNGRDSNHIPLLAVKLRNSVEWMAACQGLSQVVAEILFTNSQRQYSLSEMLSLLIANPLPGEFLGQLYVLYLDAEANVVPIATIGGQMQRPTFSVLAASQALSHLTITLQLFPPAKYATKANKVVKLAEWLLESDPDTLLTLNPDPDASSPTTQTIFLSEFLPLLDSDNISDSALGFLAYKWHQEALPGWACVAPDKAAQILNMELGTDLKSAVNQAVGGLRFGLAYGNIILPIATEKKLLGIHLSMADRLATIYTWMHDEDPLSDDSNQAIKVCAIY